MEAPTWAEISHFASFLNVQLETTERSVFCNSAVVGDELRGFKNVVVDFNLTMAQDFSSRSIEISGMCFISSYYICIISHQIVLQFNLNLNAFVFANKIEMGL